MIVTSLHVLFIYFVFRAAETPNDEDAACRKKNTKSWVWTCKELADCEFRMPRNVPRCNFGKSPTKICCPRRKKPADVVREKCLQYASYSISSGPSKPLRKSIGKRVPQLQFPETIPEEDPTSSGPPKPVRRLIRELVPKQIAGGVPANSDEYPHMALIGFPVKPGVILWHCGGSLISEQFILSAAHCSQNNGTKAQWVLLGELNRPPTISKDVRPGRFEIETAFPHPDYKEPYVNDDIILFKLRKIVTFGRTVRPICLHTSNSIPENHRDALIVTGWGRTRPDGDLSTTLREAEISLAPDSSCQTYYRDTNRLRAEYNPRSMICAGDLHNTRKDACEGDSGGPMQIKLQEYHDVYFQVGITSIGPPICAGKNNSILGIYINVTNYINWIQPIVWP